MRSRPEGEGDLLASVSPSVKWECSPADDWISSVSYNGIFSSKKEWSPPDVGSTWMNLENHAERMKPDTEDHMLWDSMDMK